jgi:hypothetical protein
MAEIKQAKSSSTKSSVKKTAPTKIEKNNYAPSTNTYSEYPSQSQTTTKSKSFELTLIEKIKLIYTNPSEFFKTTKTENITLLDSWKYLLILAIPYVILAALVSYFAGPFIARVTVGILSIFSTEIAKMYLENLTFSISESIISIPISYISIAVAIFVSTLLHWIGISIVSKGRYDQIFKIIAYSQTPMLTYGWIPFIAFIASIHGIVLQVIGASEYFNITKMRAFVGMVLIPFAIMTIIGVIVLFAFLALIFIAISASP